jgi:hypothetical protein
MLRRCCVTVRVVATCNRPDGLRPPDRTIRQTVTAFYSCGARIGVLLGFPLLFCSAVTEPAAPSAFDKARTGLWASLQKHLNTVYAAEKNFRAATRFTDTFPFSAASLEPQQLLDYQHQRAVLRDLYVDETTQLDSLVKAVRQKPYQEDDKKLLFLMILGYMDLAETVFTLLDTHRPTKQEPDEELEEATARFERVRNFVRLNIRGISGLLPRV